jgi:hypothetical protein
MQTDGVGPSCRNEPSNLGCSQLGDARLLQLVGNLVAKSHGHVQAPIADDARSSEE